MQPRKPEPQPQPHQTPQTTRDQIRLSHRHRSPTKISRNHQSRARRETTLHLHSRQS
uniref:LD45918p n=1 Tax=Drosophila melanogaster TaxID=7227 RepID=Q8SZH4_DROME|nr:LD45918p [Drosophila melanogaster]